MARRVVVALLGPVAWTPPGIDPAAWRAALAEDVVDLLATLQEVETAIAAVPADRALAESVVWPGMAVYEVPAATGTAVLGALTGYDQGAVVAADAPDLPGLTIGKLLRPLTTRPVALAPVEDAGPGLLGVASRLPVPEWLPEVDLDATHAAEVRRAAPRPGDVAVTAAWRRLRGPADLAALDPAVEGWETTRALLSGHR
ncbi:hypothetical protein E1258_29880 [Micromonospora sp. KC207]|uniref:Uncharacterized protein n=1 Tax=Micromonospora carbonacea TaxID=47853 RepID=A0A7D6CDJ5_9ACTN|nr:MULTISPECIES: hypothetical protein [unclassified Micromonospora]EEP71551.1 hypothetical protein MCAG_01878 [Micromonospora sp. ATCC 39149]QLJ97809.1 hypothetical protein HZU44_24080 [Micromonospora carbonacea]TDC45929.1 hypothetical protein E1258_29880 [Micromonospora sp. KC207]